MKRKPGKLKFLSLVLAAVILRLVNLATADFHEDNNISGPQPALPSKLGHVLVIDDWDNKVTKNDIGFNYFSGNTGATESLAGTTTVTISNESNGSTGGSLDISFDFTDQPSEVFAGYFASLFGLTDTLVSLDGSGIEPTDPTPFPDYFLDTQDIYRGFPLIPVRSVEQLRFDVRLESSEDVTLKVQLKDENDFDVFTRRTLTNTGGIWQTFSLKIPDDFNDSVQGGGDPTPFDRSQASMFSLIIERVNIGAGIQNPDTGRFLVDNLVLVDTDGEYPDLEMIQYPNGNLDPSYEEAFLDLVRATSSLYFIDWASRDTRTGGIIQDRSSFADLMTIGGVGFQLTSYVIDAERGYLPREDAATRVRNILEVLYEHPQGPDRVGTIGYQGFFYHFLGIDGLRKHNFDFDDTPDLDESLNTVELSTIDTALVIAGVVTVGEYFDGNTPIEMEIRNLAEQTYKRVNWNFMLDDSRFNNTKQFFLSWKPNEPRDDDSGRFGRFKLDDDPINPQGQYSSKDDGSTEVPGTIDFYTDEGLLISLLAMGSPNPAHRLSREVWDAMIRDDEGGSFVKTFPGSLFSYQFASVWLDTEWLGIDTHPTKPVNFFENTCEAIDVTRNYALTNPNGRATLNEHRWGLSATEGPFDNYFAEAAPSAAIHFGGQQPIAWVFGSGGTIKLEGEDGEGDGLIKPRSNASGERTIWLRNGETRSLSFELDGTADYKFKVRYSNDGPPDTIQISIDGIPIGDPFVTEDTRPPDGVPGSGWNNFAVTDKLGNTIFAPGQHQVTVAVVQADSFGVEIDLVTLTPQLVPRPLEVGTVTNYGVGSSIVHAPSEAIAALWNNAQHEDLNQDGTPDLLHSRFGFADAFNLDVNNAVVEGVVHPNESRILRASGPWASHTGFAINHGPMLIMIDNYLSDQFIPRLFMSHPGIRDALSKLFLFGDLDGDGKVNMIDFAMFAERWLETACGSCGGADLNFDRGVGMADLREFVDNWLAGL